MEERELEGGDEVEEEKEEGGKKTEEEEEEEEDEGDTFFEDGRGILDEPVLGGEVYGTIPIPVANLDDGLPPLPPLSLLLDFHVELMGECDGDDPVLELFKAESPCAFSSDVSTVNIVLGLLPPPVPPPDDLIEEAGLSLLRRDCFLVNLPRMIACIEVTASSS